MRRGVFFNWLYDKCDTWEGGSLADLQLQGHWVFLHWIKADTANIYSRGNDINNNNNNKQTLYHTKSKLIDRCIGGICKYYHGESFLTCNVEK